jgi:lipopolysaccharide cholinephosphotransferase
MNKMPLSLEELQNLEFEILKSFRDFCNQNNLRYYLCGGTLIGAIRHKGFIPWDDDIDVMMPRPDYEKFLFLNKDGMLGQHLKLDNINLNDKALSSILRIYDTRTDLNFTNLIFKKTFGCWIDIFPLDGLSNSKLGRLLHFRYSRLIQDLSIANDTKFGVKRRTKLYTILQFIILPFLPIIRIIGHDRWIYKLDKISKKYDYKKSKYVGVVEGRALEKEAMLKEEMEPAISVDFNGEKFTAMANYDEYLTNLYGNYMIPLDDAGKESRHIIEIYWRESKQ